MESGGTTHILEPEFLLEHLSDDDLRKFIYASNSVYLKGYGMYDSLLSELDVNINKSPESDKFERFATVMNVNITDELTNAAFIERVTESNHAEPALARNVVAEIRNHMRQRNPHVSINSREGFELVDVSNTVIGLVPYAGFTTLIGKRGLSLLLAEEISIKYGYSVMKNLNGGAILKQSVQNLNSTIKFIT
jgi:hypothetical protein